MGKFIAGVLAAMTIVAIAGAAYFLGVRTQTPAVVQNQTSPTPSTTATPSASPASSPKSQAATIAAIETAISTKNYKLLEPYLTESVNVILYASECCQPQTKAEAIKMLDYLNPAQNPWDFTATNPIAAKLKDNYEPLKDNIIGTSSNRFSVGFKLNSDSQITGIILIADYNLIVP